MHLGLNSGGQSGQVPFGSEHQFSFTAPPFWQFVGDLDLYLGYCGDTGVRVDGDTGRITDQTDASGVLYGLYNCGGPDWDQQLDAGEYFAVAWTAWGPPGAQQTYGGESGNYSNAHFWVGP